MKKLMKSMTAVAFAALLAAGAAGCSGTADPAPAGGNGAPAGSEKQDAPDKAAGSGDIEKDALVQGINVAMDADARWEGDTLHVKLKVDQGENGLRAFTNCMVTDQLLQVTQTAILEFTDGTVACVDVLPAD